MSDFVVKDSGERQSFETGMVRDTSEGKGSPSSLPFNAITRLSKHLELGCRNKYPKNNYKLGSPASRFFDSAFRHLIAWAANTDPSEDHLAACLFNVAGIIELEEGIKNGMHDPKLMDMPWKHPNPYKNQVNS